MVCTAERPEGGRGGTIEEDTNISEEHTIIIILHSCCYGKNWA